MTQTSFGQTDALALAVVAWLNANKASLSATDFAAQRRYRLIDDLSQIPGLNDPVGVDVIPGGEKSDRQGVASVFAAEYAIHLVFQRLLAGSQDEDEDCAVLAQLRSQLIEALKKRMFDLTDAVLPVRRVFLSHEESADGRLFLKERLIENHVFASETILIFKAAA